MQSAVGGRLPMQKFCERGTYADMGAHLAMQNICERGTYGRCRKVSLGAVAHGGPAVAKFERYTTMTEIDVSSIPLFRI